MATVHIESDKKDIAKVVLMPGSPTRSKYIAENFLNKVKEVNTVRGMLAYTGYYKDKKITIFPSGMGMASAGIYAYELFNEYDVDSIIRIGTCGSYVKDYKLNDILLVECSVSNSSFAVCLDNYKKNKINSTEELNKTIVGTSEILDIPVNRCNIFSSDVFYEKENDYLKRVKKYKVAGVEMESFALFNTARHLNKKATCLLTVSDSFVSSEKLTSKERDEGLNKMIVLALESSLKL